MAQHFLLSKDAKTLTLMQVMRMTDAEAEAMFCKVRWASTEGKPVCPACGGLDAYDCRRHNNAPRYRCKACKKDFSITSGTLFASHKLPLRAEFGDALPNHSPNGSSGCRCAGIALWRGRSQNCLRGVLQANSGLKCAAGFADNKPAWQYGAFGRLAGSQRRKEPESLTQCLSATSADPSFAPEE